MERITTHGIEMENNALKSELADKTNEVNELELEVISAMEEIHVSMYCVDIQFYHVLTFCFCFPKKLTPHIVKKDGKEWDATLTQELVIEMLAHRTPPTCVAPNILSCAELLLPNGDIVKQLERFSYTSPKLLLHTR